MSECCEECDYWDDQVDLHIDNQIKEAQLTKLAKKNSETKLIIPTNIKASGGKNKARRQNVVKVKNEVYRVGNEKVIAKVGATSSQK